ncbi:ATP-dependent nuclease, subunit B [Lachnospiraceae bacterium KM106-2]|nr:ATP-dependent nuclease, subunit B [Lachnospiraceae bacterium KM106-2]
MSLQLILGSSGSGKSHALYQEIIEKSMQYKDMNYIVVVPEQFTMQTQKDLVTMHPDHGVMNIDILSFVRLAYRVFEETGRDPGIVLEDTGKNMVLRKVIANKQDELTLFQSNVRKQGFVSELKSLLSEMLQYSIGPEELEKMIELTSNRHMLSGKLKDMLVIYNGFKEFLSEKYITAEEVLDVLCSVIEDSNILKKSVLCFDGFTGFTPSQYKLLQCLLPICKKIIVTVTIDPRENIRMIDEEYKLFHMSKKTIAKLYEVAESAGSSVDKPVYVRENETPYRFVESATLASLEHNLFRYPYKQYRGEQSDVRVLVGKDAAVEVDFTVREIKRLVQDENYRYKDIAVVTGDLAMFGPKIQKEYRRAEIPCFVDLKKSISNNPLVELIRAALDVLIRDFSYESVFRFLRCGLVDIPEDDIDQLENYVIALGIRGIRMWEKEWTRIYRTKGELDLEKINEVRTQVVEMLDEFHEALTKKEVTIAEMTQALYAFLLKEEAGIKIERYRIRFENSGELLLAKEYKQVYGIVLELLDKLVELLGDEQISIKEYKELVESGLEEAKVGLIPPGIDQVVVGDIERTRLKDIKALFFIGVNDGIIPKSNAQGGIISDLERELLTSMDITMAPTRRQATFIEQFYLYLNLTKPTNKLYVTYSKVGSNGKAVRSSYIISKLQQLFTDLAVEDLDLVKDENDVLEVLGADQGLRYLLDGLRGFDGEHATTLWKELFTWYKSREDKQWLLEKGIEGACYENEESNLNRAIAAALYGKDLTNSVTRLEKYAACAYAHFLSYGLDLNPRQEYQLRMPDIGTIFHTAMELFAKKLQSSKYNWNNIPEPVRNEIVEESVKEASLNYNNTIMLSSKRNEYMIKRVERITKRTVWALCEHVRRGNFVPSGFELKFSQLDHLDTVNIPLNNHQMMHLMGRIDRVDTCVDEDDVLVRVVDYKSGTTGLDLGKLYHGLQLQLVVYMSAAVELEEKQHPDKLVIPAGIFYYNMNDPVVMKQLDASEEEEHSDEWKEKIENEILKELKMNGLVNQEEKVIKAMDHSFVDEEEEHLKGSVSSSIVPVETTKDGSIGKRSSTANRAQFNKLSSYVKRKIKEYGDEIVNGTIALNPYELNDRTACEYCEYASVCGFDQKLPGNEYRKLPKFAKEQVWDEISEKLKEEEGEEENE